MNILNYLLNTCIALGYLSHLTFAAFASNYVFFNHHPSIKSFPCHHTSFDERFHATTHNLVDDWTPEILYENDRVFVINKPCGIGYHNELMSANSKEKDEENEVHVPEPTVDGILTLIRKAQLEGRISYSGRLYGVHRLDKVTSGILLFAKDVECAGLLSKSFRDKNVTKYYFALSAKRPKKRKQGLIKGDMIKSRRGSWQLKRSLDDPAMTRFYTCGLGKLNEKYAHAVSEVIPSTAILFQPITGKTHQLRVASKSEGMAILGDALYGKSHDHLRTYLHSSVLHMNVNGIGELCIISPPTFEELWSPPEINCKNAARDFREIFFSLLRKHCQNERILEIMDTSQLQ